MLTRDLQRANFAVNYRYRFKKSFFVFNYFIKEILPHLNLAQNLHKYLLLFSYSYSLVISPFLASPLQLHIMKKNDIQFYMPRTY